MAQKIQQLTPAIAIHPGEMLKDELDARTMKQKEFAALTGIQITQLNEIIKGKRGINADTALIIGKALQMNPAIWLNMQSNYELDIAKINEKNAARLQALDQWEMIKPLVPFQYYKKMGVLIGNPIEDIPKVKRIYNFATLDQLAGVYSQQHYARFRKSDKLTIDKINLIGWVKLVNYKALELKVAKFNTNMQVKLVEELKEVFKKNKNTIEKTTNVLAAYGIKLILQPHPEKCAVDGISFWSNNNPAIGISLRHNRIDNFAFTVMHELGHIFLHLVNNSAVEFIDLDIHSSDYKASLEEVEADDFARNLLIDKYQWLEFIENHPHFSEAAILKFANKEKIHPAIVFGRYCFEKKKFAFKSSIDRSLK
jgi:HTH-type transcriptional regulator/antitoxin HigA